jgi:hypothetical protein
MSSGLLCHVVWNKFTDVSEVLAASIINSETSVNYYTTPKTATFILAAMRT